MDHKRVHAHIHTRAHALTHTHMHTPVLKKNSIKSYNELKNKKNEMNYTIKDHIK